MFVFQFGQQTFEMTGVPFGAQPTREFSRGSSPEWLHMQIGGNFERTSWFMIHDYTIIQHSMAIRRYTMKWNSTYIMKLYIYISIYKYIYIHLNVLRSIKYVCTICSHTSRSCSLYALLLANNIMKIVC